MRRVENVKGAKKRQETRTKARLRADTAFSKIIRHPGKCANCGSSEYLQCAHGFTRGYLAVRCDFRNAFPLCRGCHKYYTHHPIEWEDWCLDQWGLELWGDIRAKALTRVCPDWFEVAAELEARLKEIEE